MNIHFKKNIIFTFYVLFNITLVGVLFLVDYGYLIVALFLFASHVRDFFSIVYQITQLDNLIREYPEIDIDNELNICALIPTYTEDYKLVKKNIDSLVEQELSNNIKLISLIVCDGLKVKAPNTKSLFDHLDETITYEDETIHQQKYKHWKTGEKVSFFYKIGCYKDKTIILGYKPKNFGKKDSLIVGEKIINKLSQKIDFIYHTDSDTIAHKNCIDQLARSLVADGNLDGVSGLVRAYYNSEDEHHPTNWFWKTWEKSLYVMQDFQYFFSLIARRQTESEINTTVCLPGCVNMIRVSKKSENAIKKYARLPLKATNFLQTVTRMQGTDRRYTTLLLKEGARLKMNWRAWVYTEPPLTVKAFINQRRRWSSNAFFNSIVLIYTKNLPFYTKVSALIDIGRLFSTMFRLFSYFTFWYFLREFTPLVITLFVTFLVFPYLYISVWIICILPGERGKMFIGFFINKIYQPFLSCITISKMFYTSTNFAWGQLKSSKPMDEHPEDSNKSDSNQINIDRDPELPELDLELGLELGLEVEEFDINDSKMQVIELDENTEEIELSDNVVEITIIDDDDEEKKEEDE